MHRSTLLGALKSVKPALSTKDFIPVLTHFCFTGESVYAYNDLIGIQVPCETSFSGAVHGTTIFSLLDKSSAKELDVAVSDGLLQGKLGKSSIKLPILSEEDFLFEPDDGGDRVAKFKMDEDFFLGLQSCLISVDTDPLDPMKMGIVFSASKKLSCFYSTDSHTVSRYELDGHTSKKSIVVVFPDQFCSQLLLFASRSDKKPQLIIYSDRAVATFGDGSFIFTRLIEENLVDKKFKDIFKEHSAQVKNCTQNLPVGFYSALDRCGVVLVNDLTKRVKMSVKGNKMILTASSSLGKVREVVRIKGSNFPEISKEINHELLQRIIEESDSFILSDEVSVFSKDRFTHLIAYYEE